MARTDKYIEDGPAKEHYVPFEVQAAVTDVKLARRGRSPSPAPRPKRYYAVRADPKIVGKAEDGGAFGIHESWDAVKRFAWKGTEPVKAAMAANYKNVGTRAVAALGALFFQDSVLPELRPLATDPPGEADRRLAMIFHTCFESIAQPGGTTFSAILPPAGMANEDKGA